MDYQKEWLCSAASSFSGLLEAGRGRLKTWEDLVFWCALEASGKGRLKKREIEDKYPAQLVAKFRCLFQHIAFAAMEAPEENVMFALMKAVLPISGEAVSRAEAEELLKSMDKGIGQSWVRDAEPGCEFMQMSFYEDFEIGTPMEYLVVMDNNCASSGGTLLPALARACPKSQRDGLLLIASDRQEPVYALMAFVQLSLMGMACYALPDVRYQATLEYNNGLFAPPGAICSQRLFSYDWAERCWASVCKRLI